jgi:hypothetical protein
VGGNIEPITADTDTDFDLAVYAVW